MAGTIDNISKAAAMVADSVNGKHNGKPRVDGEWDFDDSPSPVSENIKSDSLYIGFGGNLALNTNPNDATGGYTSGSESIGPETGNANFIGGGQIVVKFRVDTLAARFGDHVPKASCKNEAKALERCEEKDDADCSSKVESLDNCETTAEEAHESAEKAATQKALKQSEKDNPVYLQVITKFNGQGAVSDEGATLRVDFIVAPQLAVARDLLGGADLLFSLGVIYSTTVDAVPGREIEEPLNNLGGYASVSLQWDFGALALEAGLEGALYPTNTLNSDNQEEFGAFGNAGLFVNFLY